ncbi:MAG: AAA family ATPase [Candidatus Omnitrophica bacterium]|nr:AAA family ATPase [Candidatus Omnitrophota bacterium]MDD5488240.1 AAA family ATPase [Candidatus Omnitrophota bacterium]
MSYYQLLGMTKEPFSTSPDPQFFYASHEHKAALIKAMIEVRLKRGLSVIMGDVGTGKTTLCRKLLQMFKERNNIEFSMILDPDFSDETIFLDSLMKAFGINTDHRIFSSAERKEMLQDFLFQKTVEEDKTIVLLIDEAQKLSLPSLEILRVLLNYETNDFKLLQLVLVGQLELQEQLRQLRNVVDRISFKYILNPIVELSEMKELINFRLKTAGYAGNTPLFTDEAFREIYEHTQGYPRRIGMLCHNALRELIMHDKTVVTGDVIRHLVAQEIII